MTVLIRRLVVSVVVAFVAVSGVIDSVVVFV